MSSILFLDPTIPDYQSLLQGLNADTQLVILDPTQDGILQITEALKSGVFDTVHIVSHGTSGNLQLGTAQLNSATLPTYSSFLQQWSNYLTPGADILLYGCNVAQGDAGKNFVQQLHQATGADIAASDDATGSVVLGGDWNLEYSTGNITAPLAFQLGVMEAYNSVLAPFAAGDLIVLQVGTGSSALSSVATEVFLKEFNTTSTGQTGIQSIALPTSVNGSNRILTQSGSAGSEGALNLSADGKYLTLVGYDAAPGTTGVAGTTSASNNRIVARVDASGTVDTTTRISAYSGNNVRSAVTNDGSGFWVAGSSTGLTYVSYGSTGASTTLNGLNSRVVNIFNGQLYDSSQSGTNIGVNTVGTGLPTSSGQTVSPLISGLTSANSNAYAYVLLDRDAGVAGLDTLYIADQTSGLLKYSFNGSAWTARGSIAGTLTGLTGVINGRNVDLYATNGTGAANSLVKVTDTGIFNANLSGTFTTLATAPTNTIFKGVAFAPTSSVVVNPTVNLSVSANTGTEAAQTSITVTATASSAVTSDQTVTLTVSGTNITTGDYTLNNTTISSVTITILSGQTTGTATFKVVDDVLAEGDEVATLTISNPSAGITLGSTISQNITITDNDVVANTAPTILADNETVIDTDKITPFLSLPNNSPTATPTALVSGVIGDTTDPAKTIGIEFNVSDAETTASALTVTATSSNQSVVTNANLTLTQSANANSRNLKINPTGVGYSDITVTVSDGSLSSSYVIKYAASAAGSTTTRFLTGAANASTAVVIDSNYMLVGDDENQALRLYDRNNSGLPINSFDFTSSLGLTQLSGGIPREVDIEASAKIGDRIFWLGSQSNNDSGTNRPNRNKVFATDISGTGAATNLSYVGRYDFLEEDIIAWDANNGHGKGANYYGLAASAASGVGSKQSNGYNIEGLEFAPDNTTAYIAFRAPQEPTANRTKALIVAVSNFTSLLGGIQGSATFSAPIELDLGGRGIREIRKNASNQYVIIAGPAGDATGVAPDDFLLYTWTGVTTDAPVLRSADLTALNAGGSFESIVEVPNSLTSTTQLQLLVDNGTTIFYNDAIAGSDLTIPNYQKSRSETVTLGNVAGIVQIHDIQGSGSTFNPLYSGSVTIEGIVTRAFSGSTKLNGFYVQEEDADADGNSATSEAIFVFDPSGRFSGNVGDKVRVTGTVKEFTSTSNGNNSSLTELDITSGTVLNLGTSTLPTVTNIQIPVTSAADLERYEGMLVNISASNGNLTVTENFQLGRYGQVVLAADGSSNQPGTDARLDQYTQFNAPSVSGYTAYLADIAKRKIYLDDGSGSQNLDPTIFGRGGNPLSAANTLRSGDSVASITGILDERFEGYRIQTSTGVDFTPTNARPDTPPVVGGTLKVASFNVLNYFSDLDTNTNITTNGLTFEPRGANTATEFTRQRDKIIQAITKSGADVIGLMELENNGYGSSSAIQDLVNGLNAIAGTGTYTFINPGTRLGTDAIAVGLIYKPGKVTPVGAAATMPNGYGTGAFDLVGRKPLAQTFQQNSTGELFTAVVNHFKSKGSSSGGVGDADAGDGQGFSNGTRTRQAQDLATWLATKPTGTTDADYLLLGDFNAYAQEDPITTLNSAGYSNLLPNTSYSYVFDGQVGALDHALGSSSLAAQVAGAEKWHINADEPTVLDYNTEFKTAGQVSSLYNADQFRASDHDPVLVGLNLYTALPILSINNPSVTEGNSGTTPLAFTVSLDKASVLPITVNYATVNGTAYSGYDYNSTSGTLTFTGGETTKVVNVNVIGDVYNEANETFKLQLSNPSNATINTSYGTGTIINDDVAPSLSISNISVTEGNSGTHLATFNVNLSTASGQTVTVNYATANGTATSADNDYTPTSGTLTFAPGNTLLTVSIPVVGDTQVESDESFYLNLSNANGATLASSQGIGTILDDDGVASVTLTGTSGKDNLTGGDGNDNIFGLDGDDTLNGGAGDDNLTGGLGADILTGGLSADSFIYNNFNESLFSSSDRIRDFNPSAGDRIRLNNPPTAVFNAGIISATNLSNAVAAAYSDADPTLAGSQSLAANQAVFFSFGTSAATRRTYLSVNDNTAAFNASSDLFIEVTGLVGTQPTGALTTSNYFAANFLES